MLAGFFTFLKKFFVSVSESLKFQLTGAHTFPPCDLRFKALWAEVSRQRSPATPAALQSAPGDAAPNGARRARTSEERMNDLAANALLRNIYSAVSELP